jgi:hypothetical protein
MDEDKLKSVADRDQLWASLRDLREEIQKLAAGEIDGTERQQRLSVLLARIVLAELDYQATNFDPR